MRTLWKRKLVAMVMAVASFLTEDRIGGRCKIGRTLMKLTWLAWAGGMGRPHKYAHQNRTQKLTKRQAQVQRMVVKIHS